MTATLLAAMALGISAPATEVELTKFNAVFHDPVIAPYSEIILFHASVEGTGGNHSVWVLGDEGKAKRIATGAKDPVCLGVLPNDALAIIADHSETSEKYLLTNIRTGAVSLTVPSFGLRVLRALTDQLNKNMLLVALDDDDNLGLYRFPINAWYKATEEHKADFVPRKVLSMFTEPVDLVFSRDGNSFAMLDGSDLKVYSIGEFMSSKTFTFSGKVVHPRDFHPKRDLLMYESTTALPGLPGVFGEVGVLDITTCERKTAFYFDGLLEPNKHPLFDSSGNVMMVDTWGDEPTRRGPAYSQAKPVPVAFPINLDRSAVSLMLYSKAMIGQRGETFKPIMVTQRVDRPFLDVAQRFTDTQNAFTGNKHDLMATLRDKEFVGAGGRSVGVKWSSTCAFSPTRPGVYVDVVAAALTGAAGSYDDWNNGSIGRYDAGKPPAHKRIASDGIERGGQIAYDAREVQGDICQDTDIAVFGEPPSNYWHWVLHYPDWSHYGP